MVEPSNQSSLGARFRAGGWEEKPLQVVGAISTPIRRAWGREESEHSDGTLGKTKNLK
jgi:hypothetical protein